MTTVFEILPFSAEWQEMEHPFAADSWSGEDEEGERGMRAPRGGAGRARAPAGGGAARKPGRVARGAPGAGGKTAGMAGKGMAARAGGMRGKPGGMGKGGLAGKGGAGGQGRKGGMGGAGGRGGAGGSAGMGGRGGTGMGGRWAQPGPGVGRPRRWPYPYGWTGPLGGYWPAGVVMQEPDWLAVANAPPAEEPGGPDDGDAGFDGGDGDDGGMDNGAGRDDDGGDGAGEW